jgi:hypothetical protein
MKKLLLALLIANSTNAQLPFSFNNANNGRRVVLVQSSTSSSPAAVTIRLFDAAQNPTELIKIFRRPFMGNGTQWVQVASVSGGTTQWTDNNVSNGQVWEYQIRRTTSSGDAIGYTSGALQYDQTNYRGRLILLIDSSFITSLAAEINILKKDLTGDGWFIEQLYVNRANGWYSGSAVAGVKQKIKAVYDAAPANDKPQLLFMLGHIPIPRSGRDAFPPDEHDENKGARGADTYYADMDGVYTDNQTYNPGNLVTPLAINLPNDFKWDQDFLPSNLEMGFGRVDFADLTQTYPATTELELTRRYLNRLHHYKQVATGWYMGKRMAFNFGYDNSNDGTYRSLPNIVTADSIQQYSGNLSHPQWVKDNGPFLFYMQNIQVPDINQWLTIGMNATAFTSDQSYYGFGDVAEDALYSKIRALLAADTKCLVTLWTTTGINIFHQPGAGVPFGIACKHIMNHNQTNNILEKPSQQYDTPDWWNRTHFQYHGDPSLRFLQVRPPSAPAIEAAGTNIKLKWNKSTEINLAGYHVYRSTTEFGKYDRITNSPVADTSYIVTNSVAGEWYMIRAVVLQTTGSGSYFNPSQGIFIQNNITTGLAEPGLAEMVIVYPNPAQNLIQIKTPPAIIIKNISLFDAAGGRQYIGTASNSQVDISHLTKGVYVLKLATSKGEIVKKIIIW